MEWDVYALYAVVAALLLGLISNAIWHLLPKIANRAVMAVGVILAIVIAVAIVARTERLRLLLFPERVVRDTSLAVPADTSTAARNGEQPPVDPVNQSGDGSIVDAEQGRSDEPPDWFVTPPVDPEYRYQRGYGCGRDFEAAWGIARLAGIGAFADHAGVDAHRESWIRSEPDSGAQGRVNRSSSVLKVDAETRLSGIEESPGHLARHIDSTGQVCVYLLMRMRIDSSKAKAAATDGQSSDHP